MIRSAWPWAQAMPITVAAYHNATNSATGAGLAFNTLLYTYATRQNSLAVLASDSVI